MATYTVVAEKALDPDDIREVPPGSGNFVVEAGHSFEVADGDMVVFTSGVDKDTTIETAATSPIDVGIVFSGDSTSDYKVTIEEFIDAEISIPTNDTNLQHVEIDAKDSNSTDLSGGDDITLKQFVGSDDGTNSFDLGENATIIDGISMGNNSTATGYISLGAGSEVQANGITTSNGNDTVLLGEGVSITGNIVLGNGTNTLNVSSTASNPSTITGGILGGSGIDNVTLGDNTTVTGRIGLGEGSNTLTGGNDVTIRDYLAANNGNDTVTFGSGLTSTQGINLGTGTGTGSVTLGDDATILANGIRTGTGQDTVTIGENADITGNIDLESGTNSLNVGDGSIIRDDIIGKDGNDTIQLGSSTGGVEVQGQINLGDGTNSLTVVSSVSNPSKLTGDITAGSGADTLIFGDGIELGDVVAGDKISINTNAGDDVIEIGANSSSFIGKIDTGDGADLLTVGDDSDMAFGTGIDMGDGNDTAIFGDGLNMSLDPSLFGKMQFGAGDDSVTIGDNANVGGDVELGDGNDTLEMGDGGSFEKLDSGKGDDSVRIGDNTEFEEINMGGTADQNELRLGLFDDGQDRVIKDASKDGGDGDTSDDDTLYIAIDPADQADFEALLASEGYVYNATTMFWEVDDDEADYKIEWDAPSDGRSATHTIENWESIRVVCFTRDTHIATDQGERLIQDLAVGDMVMTMDHGMQPIRWIGSTTVPALGHLAPIRIKAGALGNARDLVVSPQHRMLLSGWQMELLFAEGEVLAPAKALVNDETIIRERGGMVEYYHMLFDTHEIVFAEGTPSESFHPGQEGLGGMEEATRNEVLELFPELAEQVCNYGPSARKSLKLFEAEVAAAELAKAARKTAQPGQIAQAPRTVRSYRVALTAA